MARKSAHQDDDVAVDQYGNPLPEVRLRNKAGQEVVVRDAAGLSNLHYGAGFDFVDDGMTYAEALGQMLGDQRKQVLVDVDPEGADVVWPQPVLPGAEGDAGDNSAEGDVSPAKTAKSKSD